MSLYSTLAYTYYQGRSQNSKNEEASSDRALQARESRRRRCRVRVFFPHILRLNHHQLGCRPSLSATCLLVSYVRYVIRLKRYSRSSGSILKIFGLHNTPLPNYLSFLLSFHPLFLPIYPLPSTWPIPLEV